MKQNQLKVKRLETGQNWIVSIIKGFVYDNHGKKNIYCGCTGHTVETATPMQYDGKEIYCPNCHEKKVEIIETYDDYLKRRELENQKKLEDLKIVLVGSDWECGLKFYGLSVRLDYDDWLLVKDYFTFKNRGWSRGQELEWNFGEPCGWITRQGFEVQNVLFENGLIKEANLREFEEWEM